MKKILVAMSGGVDSSVAAYRMKERGCACIGVTMRLFDNQDAGMDRESTCCSLSDVEDARSVARRLEIPYYVFNFTEDFRSRVMEPFARAYEQGVTPNPCIDCNRFLKFERLYQRALVLGCDGIATGHYAQITWEGNRWMLKKAVDTHKDQSYVLYSLTQAQLAHTFFPLGTLTKQAARSLAQAQGFRTAQKHDSQDICFAPDGDYAAAITRITGKTYPPGNFVDRNGQVLGRHRGIVHYTIGQRKGLGLALPEAGYVCGICCASNTVRIGRNADLYTRALDAVQVNWIACPPPFQPLRVKARIRYHQQEQRATVTPTGEDSFHLEFDDAQRAITPGQAVVLYDGDLVVGGGTIAAHT